MTGRDLVIHILSNNLEDADISEMFITEEEAAVRCKVGVATLKAWASMGIIHYISINDKKYILPNDTLKRFEEELGRSSLRNENDK